MPRRGEEAPAPTLPMEIHPVPDGKASPDQKTIVVVGLSMVGWRFCESLVSRDTERSYRIVTFCEEPNLACKCSRSLCVEEEG